MDYHLTLRTNKENIRIIGGLILLRFRSNFFMVRIPAAIGRIPKQMVLFTSCQEFASCILVLLNEACANSFWSIGYQTRMSINLPQDRTFYCQATVLKDRFLVC